jgi:hypothetical protein
MARCSMPQGRGAVALRPPTLAMPRSFVRPFLRRFLHVLAVAASGLCIAVAAAPAVHHDDGATDEAFDALLSLPQGLPINDRAFPTSGEPVRDEAALEVRLQALLAEGADVDAYRHEGTLLQHAVRGGLDDTALWLLVHGADPRLRLQGDRGVDALQLAIRYRRWRVVDALLRQPAIAPANDRDRALRWTAVLESPAGVPRENEAAFELARRLPLPGGWYGGCLLVAAHDRLIVPMVVYAQVAASAPARPEAGNAADAAIAATCRPGRRPWSEDVASTPALGRYKVSDLARADARLADPLLPWLVPALASQADVRTWSTLPLRRPWQDARFTRGVLRALALAELKASTRGAVVAALPSSALAAALDDDATLHDWMDSLNLLQTGDAAASLALVDDAVLRRRPLAAMTGLAHASLDGARAYPGPARPKADLSTWQALIARLPMPLPTVPGVTVTEVVPEDAWPALLARGWRPAAADLSTGWQYEPGGDWMRRWRTLQAAAAPEVRAAALDEMLAPWAGACDLAWEAPQPGLVDRLRLAAADGARPSHPVTLSTRCVRLADASAMAALQPLGFAVVPAGATTLEPPPDAPPGHFVFEHRACSAEPPLALVQAVLRRTFLVAPNRLSGLEIVVSPDLLQPIDAPGAARCAWLASGGSVDRWDEEDDDTFDGGVNYMRICGEGALYGELWRVADDGRVSAQELGQGTSTGAIALEEEGGARRYLVTLPVAGGHCNGGVERQLYAWTQPAGAPQLVALGTRHPAALAFQKQCDAADPGPCFGLPSIEDLTRAGEDAQSASKSDAMQALPMTADAFVARYAAPQRQRWLAAFLALDLPTLQAASTEGVYPRWRLEGLDALTASPMPLAQKRKRIAWLFRDHAGLATSFGVSEYLGATLVGLVAWLPREDWRPLLDAIVHSRSQSFMLADLRKAANERHDAALACTFTRAMGQDCARLAD